MNDLNILFFLFFGAIASDLGSRWASDRIIDGLQSKTAGLFSLLLMSLHQGSTALFDKSSALKRYFLSILVILYLWLQSYFLLLSRPTKDLDFHWLAIAISPFFIMPFYHLIYGLIGLRALSTSNLMINFRLRGAISMLLSANLAFAYISPQRPKTALVAHFALAALALIGSFHLCAGHRRMLCTHSVPSQTEDDVSTVFANYLAAIFEFFYYAIFIYLIFIHRIAIAFFPDAPEHLSLPLGVAIILMAMALAVKSSSAWGSSIFLHFLEERAIPLSFILHGAISVYSAYF